MRVQLIDVDSSIPNLALMKLSTYRKQTGDIVGFNIDNPEVVYISVIYKKNRYRVQEIANSLILKANPLILIGGSGWNFSNFGNLPDEIDLLKPDYDLYPSTYSQGFTTRGCIRNCPFCIVPRKEGKFQIRQHPKDFYDDRFDTIMIMDNNWLADYDWFKQTISWIIDQDLKLIEHGMDIRLLTPDKAELLSRVKLPTGKMLHFAFDDISYKNFLFRGIENLNDVGINLRSQVMFYVYMNDNFDNSYNSALERCRILKNLGTNPYLMFNIDEIKNRRTKNLERWVNNKYIFWKIDFEDYKSNW